jgi:hypothetical protein
MAFDYIKKGDRIRAEWFGDGRPVPLAGAQLKFQVTKFEVVGVVKHVRGDRPVNPTVRFYVDPDHEWTGATVTPEGCTCGHAHVEVNPKHIRAVEPAPTV